jgi:hypothetical protein
MSTRHRLVAGFVAPPDGYSVLAMFVWSRGPRGPRRVKFYWWPLLFSIGISLLLTWLVNQ